MGGSGSGGWHPTSSTDPCNTLTFQAAVNSPQPTSISKLKVGNILSVSLQTSPQTVVVVEFKKSVVGALTGPKISRLVSCLQNGYIFKAKVLSISGGNCTVEVQPA